MEKIKIATERLFLRSPNINVCFRMKIAGSLGREKFEAAMDDVGKRHPLLHCSIAIDDEHNAWFVPHTSHVEIEYYTPGEMADWQDWYKKTDAVPFDFLHGPLAKICVIVGHEQMEIIILGHHIIGDGIGYLNLAKDVLLALDSKLDPTPQVPPVNNQFKEGGKLGLLSKLYARKLNKEWGKNRVGFSENDYRVFFEHYRARFIPQRYLGSIDEADLKKIIEKCKANRLTVNEIITSAFSVAMVELSEHYPRREIQVGVAVNTRNEVETTADHCMGDYVSGIAAEVTVTEEDFMSNTRSIAAMLRGKLNDIKTRHLIVNFLREFDADLIESIMFAAYGDYQLPISKKIGERVKEGFDHKGLGMSNLGRHEFTHYDAFQLLDLQFIGPAFPANLLSVSIITVNNRLNISLAYNETEIKPEAVKKIYERAVGLLLEAS